MSPILVHSFRLLLGYIVIWVMSFHLFWHVNYVKNPLGIKFLSLEMHKCVMLCSNVFVTKYDCPKRYKMYLYFGQYCTSVRNCNRWKRGVDQLLITYQFIHTICNIFTLYDNMMIYSISTISKYARQQGNLDRAV